MNTIRTSFMLIALIIFLFSTNFFSISPIEALVFFILAGASGSFLSAYLRLKSIEITDLSKIALIRSADPLIILFYSIIILNEILNGQQLLGGFIILFGLILLILGRNKV